MRTPGRANGFTEPAAISMAAGVPHRLRIVNINPDYRAWIRLKRDDALLEWRPVAKDGFDVPAHQATSRPAEVEMGPGETADFFFTPEDPGSLEIVIDASTGDWTLVQPIEVR